MFACRTNATAEAIEAFIRVRRRKPPFTDLSSSADCFRVEVKPLDLSEDTVLDSQTQPIFYNIKTGAYKV
jgi:hypothetical protein